MVVVGIVALGDRFLAIVAAMVIVSINANCAFRFFIVFTAASEHGEKIGNAEQAKQYFFHD